MQQSPFSLMSRLQDVTYVTSLFLRLVGEQESIAIFCCLGIRSNLLFPALWLMTPLMTRTWRWYFLQDQRRIIPGFAIQEATVITLLEISDMNEELDQFLHNAKTIWLYCSYTFRDMHEGNNSFKNYRLCLIIITSWKTFWTWKRGGVSRRRLYFVVLLFKYNS